MEQIMPFYIRQLDLELFGGCNFDCDMCPQQNNGREKSFRKMMPWNIFTKVVDEAIELGTEAVSLHGSGEPTLCKYLPEAIKYCKDRNLKTYVFTNGYLLTPDLGKKLIDNGIDFVRISAIGYDSETYHKWMSKPVFNIVQNNAKKFAEYTKNTDTQLHMYHLITNTENINYELEMYKKNWVDNINAYNEIWMMHNWSGLLDDIDKNPYSRKHMTHTEKRTCGRPFSPILQVRAGGIDNLHGAVVACCMVLGRDSEAVLGHLETNTIREVWNNKKFQDLRTKHINKLFDKISYCKDCDQLYDVPESLVWTNIPNRKYGQSKGIRDLSFKNVVD